MQTLIESEIMRVKTLAYGILGGTVKTEGHITLYDKYMSESPITELTRDRYIVFDPITIPCPGLKV